MVFLNKLLTQLQKNKLLSQKKKKKPVACCRTVLTMSSPPLRGSAEWSAKREVEVLLGLTRGNHYAAQQLWLRRERLKAEASQVASAGSPQASQRAAGCQASGPLAAKPSRPRLGHGTCPGPGRRSRPPDSPRIGGASIRSTSRARCGPTCVWQAGSLPGACERAFAAR